jgi:adenine deaminase
MIIPISRDLLVDVAAGRLAPTMVIRDVQLVNVLSREIHPATILMHGERIAAVLPPSVDVPPALIEIDGRGRFALPGFVDPHLHTESSAVSLSEFARAVLPRGLTTIICDPHEFGNVLGRRGMDLYLEEASHIPLTVKLRVPPRVPEMPDTMESAGGALTYEETIDLLDLPQAACLAGDINPQFFLRNDPRHTRLIQATIARGKTVSGYSPGLTGRSLNAYVASGAEDTHAPQNLAELVDDLRHGLNVFLTPRPNKFDRHEFRALAELLASDPIDTRRLCLCTDDIPTDRLLSEGHIDHRLRMAMAEGIPPLIAFQMATINPAAAMRIERDHGSVTAGKFADILLVDDLASVAISTVVYHGKVVFEDGVYIHPPSEFRFPDWAKDTIRLKGPIDPRSLLLPAAAGATEMDVNAIVLEEVKRLHRVTLPVRNGRIVCDPEQDVVHVAVLDRYTGSGRIGRGFAFETGLKFGAVASTINHNAHNLFAFGRDAGDMAMALERLIAIGGGYVLVRDGVVVAELSLPVIGMISEAPLEEVAEGFRLLEAAVVDKLGCTSVDQPLLQLSFFCAPVVPHFGLTDFGMINTQTFEREEVVLAAA